MRQIKLELKPYGVFALPSGGWLISNYQTQANYGRPFRNTFILIDSSGNISPLGRGLPYFSKKEMNFCISDPESHKIIWSENKEAINLKGFERINYCSHFSSGIFVCTNFDLKDLVSQFEKFRCLHRKFPNYTEFSSNGGISLALMPQFTYNSIKEGERHKNTIFFLKVDTGEHRSIEAVGMKKVKLAYPSCDGLTAIAVDGDGNGLIIDNPF